MAITVGSEHLFYFREGIGLTDQALGSGKRYIRGSFRAIHIRCTRHKDYSKHDMFEFLIATRYTMVSWYMSRWLGIYGDTVGFSPVVTVLA